MTDVFYKATQPDGTSFHDPDIKYVVGKRVRPKPFDGDRRLCGAGVLHASRRPEDAASYAKYPFSLFKVEGTPFAEQSDKAGFRQLRVLEKIPSWEAFGPQGEQVLAALDRMGTLTDDELDSLTAQDQGSTRAWARARGRARAWTRDHAPTRAQVWARAWDRTRGRARIATLCADYVAAVSIQDLIDNTYTQADHDLLVRGWEVVVGVWDGVGFVPEDDDG